MISLSKVKHLLETEEESPNLDYKDELDLETDGDKAQFVKDILSLANSGKTAHVGIGVEDNTRKLLGIKASLKAEQLNDILKDKCDPPLYIEYTEKTILGHRVGVIEINGDNPPYIVAVHDRYGGKLSKSTKNYCYIWRGMVFTRAFNKNEGASRSDLDKMYKIKYVTLQADLKVNHEVSIKCFNDYKEVELTFIIENFGDVIATHTDVVIQFDNIIEIVRSTGGWQDISHLNNGIPTIELFTRLPYLLKVERECCGVVVKVDNNIKQINTYLIIGATNMKTKTLNYIIPLKESDNYK